MNMEDEILYENTSTDINCQNEVGNVSSGYCNAFFDSVSCWPETPANTTAMLPCPNVENATAFRYCPANASWTHVFTNYSSCLDASPTLHTTPDPLTLRIAETMRDIYFIISAVSLVLLIITTFIFQYFRSLHCNRITIHKHLVVSFILRFIINIIITEHYVFKRKSSYRDVDWLCKTVTVLSQYSILANVFWMFVEGFFLHHSLVLGVFSTQEPFKLFYFLGWGLPALIVVAWSLVLHFVHPVPCWVDFSQIPSHYIIIVPFLLALGINLVFLVNIIRVLVSKLRANNHEESNNIKKAIKATVVLMPLLGLTNLLFVMKPGENRDLRAAYHVTNAILQSSQGIFVAILYCFLNGEVRRVLKQKWYRFRIRHVRHTSIRRRSSRTSSFFLTTGTEEDDGVRTNQKGIPAVEQLKILQTNLALQNDITPNHVSDNDDNLVGLSTNVTACETSQRLLMNNNNNGDVHFDTGYGIDRETVI